MRRGALPAAACNEELLRSRLDFEYRLGNHLAGDDAVLDVARHVCMACGRYVKARAAADATSTDGKTWRTYQLLQQILQPAPLPFARHAGSPWAGRARNVRELQGILEGTGNIRELLGCVWLSFSFVIGEHMVGRSARPDAVDVAERAGFDADVLREWLALAVETKRAKQPSATLSDLDAKRDFLRMPWHPVFELNRRTHVLSSHPQRIRVWSRDTRAGFLRAGGSFSRIEETTVNPFGKERVPWIDPARFTDLNEEDALVRLARTHAMPMRTGISRVSMQMMQFARVTRVPNLSHMRVSALGYVLSVRAHSFLEGSVGTASFARAPLRVPLNYRESDILDWGRVESACGPVPDTPIAPAAYEYDWSV